VTERLQKILSRSGYGSRRQCERIIAEGRVSVNGQVALIGEKADTQLDEIIVDGCCLRKKDNRIYIKINKPRRVISSRKSQGERLTVFDLVPINDYIFIVGRLDYDSEGLMLLTNDGKLANYLMHPRYKHEKEYNVLVEKVHNKDQLIKWKSGVLLKDGTIATVADIGVIQKDKNGTWISVVLTEGRKRQIREMGRLTGLQVKRIIRMRIGTLLIGDLKPGQWNYLSKEEISKLQNEVSVKG